MTLINPDYTYGRNVQRDATAMIEAAGDRVIGATTHAFETADFSASLLAAKASRADAIALATTTGHAVGLIKQGEEFGIRAGGQQMVPLSLTLHDKKSVGLQAAQGMIETAPYYWDQNDATRGFAERYRKRVGNMANMVQASAYGAALLSSQSANSVSGRSAAWTIASTMWWWDRARTDASWPIASPKPARPMFACSKPGSPIAIR